MSRNEASPSADVLEFTSSIVSMLQSSRYAPSTLILVLWDESGGYFDHIAPPTTSGVDNQPYGPRVPLIALGPFARSNFVSHVAMEHSSIVRFIEWRWLGSTEQLGGGRDQVVNNIGSLIDPAAAVPEN
jgi:phospholipase C